MRAWWLITVLLLAGAGWAWSSGRVGRALLALQILDDLGRGGPRSWLKRATPAPTRSTTVLEHGAKRFAADIYRAGNASRPAPLLLIPGLVEQGKDDPRVRPFAELLARAGFLVIVPDLPSFRVLRVHPTHVEELGAAFDAVVHRDDLAPGRAGMFTISYAAGVSLLTALDPTRAPRVALLAMVGGYADLDTVLRFLATGQSVLRGRMQRVEPDPYGQLVFLRTYEPFVPAGDRQVLEAMAARRFRNPRAAIADLAPRLSSKGRVIYDLFESGAPDQVPELISQLPAGLRQQMAALSPARHSFAPLRAKLYLVHARHDATFPASESHALARLARPFVPVTFVELESLQHVEPRPWHRDLWGFLRRDLAEAVRMAAWWYRLLGERERMGGPRGESSDRA